GRMELEVAARHRRRSNWCAQGRPSDSVATARKLRLDAFLWGRQEPNDQKPAKKDQRASVGDRSFTGTAEELLQAGFFTLIAVGPDASELALAARPCPKVFASRTDPSRVRRRG